MSPFKFRLFLLAKVPAAFIAGLRLQKLDTNEANVRIKYKWLNTNPFKSIYFAVLAMAAEISTGILCFYHIDKKKKNIALLVTSHTGNFHKKAVGKIVFKCTDGQLINDALDKTIATGEGEKCTLKTIGYDELGDAVADFTFEWSFKLRSRK